MISGRFVAKLPSWSSSPLRPISTQVTFTRSFSSCPGAGHRRLYEVLAHLLKVEDLLLHLGDPIDAESRGHNDDVHRRINPGNIQSRWGYELKLRLLCWLLLIGCGPTTRQEREMTSVSPCCGGGIITVLVIADELDLSP